MKKLLGIALLVAIVATGINDIGRYFTTRYTLGETSGEIARAAADRARAGNSRDAVAMEAATFAVQRGIEVTAYDQNTNLVTVYTRAKVEGTWVLTRVVALVGGNPMETPMYVIDKEKSLLQ